MPESRSTDPPGDAGHTQRKADGVLSAAAAMGAAAGHAASHAGEPLWWAKMPSPWKAFIQLGLLGMFVVLFAVYFYDNRAAVYRADAERRARDADEREISRAKEFQADRRAESLAGELRAVGQKFDALANKLDGIASEHRAANNEMRAAGQLLDRLVKELRELVEKVMKTGGARAGPEPDPLGFVNPIPWLTDHKPPAVMPGGVR